MEMQRSPNDSSALRKLMYSLDNKTLHFYFKISEMHSNPNYIMYLDYSEAS